MVDTAAFVDALIEKITFFSGVPDSLLKDFNTRVMQQLPPECFWTTPNEGSAIALTAGYYLATGKPGAVYMQNSGIGNAVNPLLSLNDPLVYGIPVLLIIGWRGKPGTKDEPQHVKQGLVTEDLLKACGIGYWVLPDDTESALSCMEQAVHYMNEQSTPVALLVQKGIFQTTEHRFANGHSLTREEAIDSILQSLDERCSLVSSTGMISREVFECREKNQMSHDADFLTVGSMGHTSQIALGIALQKPERKIICLDGDGAFLMHMGGAATIGTAAVSNYIHVVLNNEAHDSVGGQPTIMGKVSIPDIAMACGYTAAIAVEDREGLLSTIEAMKNRSGRFLLEVKVAQGARKDLGRPTQSPRDSKQSFMRHLTILDEGAVMK